MKQHVAPPVCILAGLITAGYGRASNPGIFLAPAQKLLLPLSAEGRRLHDDDWGEVLDALGAEKRP